MSLIRLVGLYYLAQSRCSLQFVDILICPSFSTNFPHIALQIQHIKRTGTTDVIWNVAIQHL